MRCQTSLLHSFNATYASCRAPETYIVRIGENYYHVDRATFEELLSKDNIVAKESISDSIFPLMAMLAVIVLSIALSISVCIQLKLKGADASSALVGAIAPPCVSRVLFVAFLVANLGAHEAGHAIALKCLYRHATIRLGFKFTFVFPTFYITSSDGYMLPRFKRAAVHMAGNCANSAINAVLLLLCPRLGYWTWYIALLEISNLIPVMKSDGYNCIQSLLFKFAKKPDPTQEKKTNAIRGLITLPIAFLITQLLNSIVI